MILASVASPGSMISQAELARYNKMVIGDIQTLFQL